MRLIYISQLLNDYVNWKDFELTYILPEHNLKYKTLSDTNDVSLKTKKKEETARLACFGFFHFF